MGRLRIAVAAAFVVLTAAACSGSPSTSTTTTPAPDTSSTTTSPDPVGSPPPLKLTTITTADQPTAMAQRDGDAALYVTERSGVVRAVRDGVFDPTPVLDLRSEIRATGSEQGLLGMAFAPGSSKFYLDYTDTDGNTQITEFQLDDSGAVDLHTRRAILSQKQPYPNHNGGQLAFGPDGMLYIAFGDGGSENDPQKNGQNLSTLLGKILRIDPRPGTAGAPYTIPFDNPYAKQIGARGEIWAYGLRNPWRFSFDPKTENMWIADVGQGKWEEIDVFAAGGKNRNFGWSLREGTHELTGGKPADAVDPVYEYSHDGGACSVTGGFVYRGTTIPGLAARYVFSDYCTGVVSTLTHRGSQWQTDATSLKVPLLASFGEDHNGELYVLSQNGTVARIDPA
jgi:glucose/arabinose dehydrogenase